MPSRAATNVGQRSHTPMKKIIPLILLAALSTTPVFAELKVLTEIPAPPAVPTGDHLSLPQKHDYQKQLRAFMATLKEADFVATDKPLANVPTNASPDDQFREWLLSLSPPSVGYKRNFASVRVHPGLFTLGVIENTPAILRAPVHPEALIDLADWNYAGNPHYNSKALRLRAFVICALDLVMLDNLLETGEEKAKPNQDQLCLAIARLAYVYDGFKDTVSAEVRTAYLAGLKKLVRRAIDHGPKELPRTLGMVTAAAPALALSCKIINDPALTKDAEAYAKKLFSDPQFFSAAGYFPHGATLDSFNGMSLVYALWGTAAGDWAVARDAMAQAHKLRAHLTLPEPDGYRLGPSHMSSLTSPEPFHDQWNWPWRGWAAAIVTDEAACLTPLPTNELIKGAQAATASSVQGGINELPWTAGGLDPKPWILMPGIVANIPYRYYPKGYYERRVALDKTDMGKLPVLREGSFIRRFSDEFLVAKTSAHAAIIHTGAITNSADLDGGFGFGGGALSAYWTRATGSVILGRGVGAWSPMYKKIFESWRSLPSHAVTGITTSGKIFTSAHIAKPESTFETTEKTYSIVAHGLIPSTRQIEVKPPAPRETETLFTGKLDYTRKFDSTANGVHITTTIKSESTDAIAELYETLPVYLRDASQQLKVEPTKIEFQIDGKWSPGTDALAANVTAIKLTRFDGAVAVTFDKPARVKLAPVWNSTYMSYPSCQNILIDLLDGAAAGPIKDVRTVGYRIEPTTK